MKSTIFAVAMILAAQVALAQQERPQQPPEQRSTPAQSFSDMRERAAQSNFRALNRADQQGWLDSMGDLSKLREKLASAWQAMGMTPQNAKLVADAYDPELASRSHHTPLRGKGNQEIAQLIQDALAAKNYLKANQLLIDFERQQLALNEMSSGAR